MQVPKRLSEGDGLDPVGSSSQRDVCRLFNPQCRQWVACISATLTMVIVGTVYGWTTTSLLHLTSGTGDAPLTLTHDESSWIVSLTVLGSMIGSLIGAQLADRYGCKKCLLLCSIMFFLGWLIIYTATSVPNLYLARTILGIGVGIAYTINPMYVSEVADINIRGAIGFSFSVGSRESTGSSEIYVDVTKQTWLAKLRIIKQRNNRKALFIMLGLIMAQQLSGNFITMQYLEVLFNKTTVSIEPNVATILVLAVGLISGILSTLTVESLGRRTLLILSTLGSCFTLFILATYLLLVQYKFNFSIVSILPVIDIIIYQVMFQIGLGTLPNVLLCELFPAELRGFVGAIIVIFDGIIGFTVSKLYQVITDNVGSSAIYFIFATSCCLAFLMVFRWVPETKGKTYHEIEALLVGKSLNSLNEQAKTHEMNIRRI